MKRTLEGTQKKRRKVSGFRERMKTPGGRRTLARRRAKGRHKLAM
jgi:large subunit ribosomal protein L34